MERNRRKTMSLDVENECETSVKQMLDIEKKQYRLQIEPRNISIFKCSTGQAWRERVVEWYYQMTDSLGEKRSVVFVALSILDRFCIQRGVSDSLDRKAYELASMSAYLLAVRLTGSVRLDVNDLLSMSRFGLSKNDFHRMGKAMLQYMKSTFPLLAPYDFVRALLLLCTADVVAEEQNMILTEAAYLCEVCVTDSSLTRTRPSLVAVAAIIKSLRNIPLTKANKIIHVIETATAVKTESVAFRKICTRLYDACVKSDTCLPHVICCEDADVDDRAHGFPHQQISNLVHVISSESLATGSIQHFAEGSSMHLLLNGS